MDGRLKSRLKAYTALTAGALAVASQAEAAVQWSGLQNLTVDPTTSPVQVDLNNDGTVDFTFSAYSTGTTYTTILGGIYTTITNRVSIYPATGASWIDDSNNNDPARLSSGYQIRATLANPAFSWDNELWDTLASYRQVLYNGSITSIWRDGNFVGQRGYIGVRFQSAQCNNGSYHYGWIHFEGAADASSGTVIEWAYEDQCDTPIVAGDTGQQAPAPTSVPTLEEWGALGMAALLAGAAAMRLRKREEAAG